MPFHLGPIRPLQDRVAGELAAIVAHDYLRLGSFLNDPVHRWSLDFVSDQLTDGRRFRVLTVVELKLSMKAFWIGLPVL